MSNYIRAALLHMTRAQTFCRASGCICIQLVEWIKWLHFYDDKKYVWDSFILLYGRPFILQGSRCLGWGYSKAQSAIPILLQQNLGPWLAHMLFIGTSPNTTCTRIFRAQQSFQFIYITYPNSAFSLPQMLFVPPIQLFKLSQQHILYKHLLILISAKYLWSVKYICVSRHILQGGSVPANWDLWGIFKSVGLVPGTLMKR